LHGCADSDNAFYSGVNLQQQRESRKEKPQPVPFVKALMRKMQGTMTRISEWQPTDLLIPMSK